MAYIGKQPVVGNFVKLDAITTSATATYNLTNGGVAYFPQTANNCIVSLNGVIQSPTSAYTISGSTIIFSDALTSSDTIDFILVLGDVLSIGTPSDGTITSAKLASGVSGLIAWQSVVTASTLTAVAGRGYFIDTTSNACTVTLPASATTGDTIILVDYARNWGTNAVTLNQNSLNFQGFSSPNPIYNTSGQSVTLIYSGATKGWIPTVDDDVTNEVPQSYSVDFLVIAGGASGGAATASGGGGAGGYRSSNSTYGGSGGGASAESSLSLLPGSVYTITVGAGGTAASPVVQGNNGNNSLISGTGITTITSTGGGGGSGEHVGPNSGGSGGGGADNTGVQTGASGTANQGYAGGNGAGTNSGYTGGGGGGSSAVGVAGSGGSGGTGGAGGAGKASTITGSSVTRAGGGGGAVYNGTPGTGGTGGGGNGGKATTNTAPTAGSANTGSGGGGSGLAGTSGAGGSGVVILRMLTSKYSGTTTGSPTVSTSGSDTILVYNASGSYTA